jgi:hypothetical protein
MCDLGWVVRQSLLKITWLKNVQSENISAYEIRRSTHRLFIETGRHTNLPRNMRLCTLCSSLVVEDEFYFVLKCDCLAGLCVKYLKKYYYTRICWNGYVGMYTHLPEHMW